MGGDHGLPVTIPACVRAVRANPALHLILVGDQAQIKKHLNKHEALANTQFSIVHATETVLMDELPSHALRNKKDSSMRVAINLVKTKEAQACVSAGNTGALMATSRYVLKTLPGIDRPAIIAEFPTASNKTRVMDLGANVDSCAEHLFQFAIMGSAFIQAVDHNPRPKIGLLNIGVEEIKGNDQVKHTAHLLSQCPVLNYIGYVEGDQLFSGEVDLVVCDGFVGNAVLKANEGLAKMMISTLKSAFKQGITAKIRGFLALPALNFVKKHLDPACYNGASMLGLNGIVIKSHGGADSRSFQYAIEKAVLHAENNVIDLVRDQINHFINQGLLQ